MNDGMITMGNWETFLNLPGEKLLLARRKHHFVVFLPILFTSFFAAALLLVAFSFFLIFHTFYTFPLFLITALLIISFALSLFTKTIIDWYFHIYILTNKKIIEVWYTPLASHQLNDILLDKVNCTEVDVRINGLVHELMDIGDVVITFDRPTHQEEFVLSDIEGCDKVGKFLTQELMNHEAGGRGENIWLKKPTKMFASY